MGTETERNLDNEGSLEKAAGAVTGNRTMAARGQARKVWYINCSNVRAVQF